MRNRQLGWVCAMLDILGENEMSGSIKSKITEKRVFTEAYDYEFEEMVNKPKGYIIITLLPLLDELDSYVDKGVAKDIDFNKMYDKLVKEERV